MLDSEKTQNPTKVVAAQKRLAELVVAAAAAAAAAAAVIAVVLVVLAMQGYSRQSQHLCFVVGAAGRVMGD